MLFKLHRCAWILGATLLASTVGAPAAAPGDQQPSRVTNALGVTRQNGHWVLQAQGMPRGQLAQQLAMRSGTVLNASLADMDRAAPALLTLRTQSLADAWRAVLGDEFSHAVMCDGSNCRVWVTGLLQRPTAQAPQQSSTADVNPSNSPITRPAITADPPGLFPAEPATD